MLTVRCELEPTASLDITGPLTSCISSGNPLILQLLNAPRNLPSIILNNPSFLLHIYSALRPEFDYILQFTLGHSTIKSAFTWLSALPLTEYGYALYKVAFMMPFPCIMGGLYATPLFAMHVVLSFHVNHTLSCPKGSLLSL